MSDNIDNKTNGNTNGKVKEHETLPNLIRDIIFHYIKYYYEKWLKDNDKKQMTSDEIVRFIEVYYNEKQKDMRKYIRKTLKENLGAQYNQMAVENIFLEITQDPEFAKTRIRVEIEDYQDKVQ